MIGAHPLRPMGLGAIVLYKNDPPGRTIYDCGSLIYEYPNGVKMSFTQNVFHPRGMPNGEPVHLRVRHKGRGGPDGRQPPTMYPLERGGSPVVLAEKAKDNPHAHIVAFYACVRKGGKNPADITIGASAALTAILGHEAMSKEKVVTWEDMGVKV